MTSRSESERCPTSSGRYRCDLGHGHDGPCETTEPAPAWSGPARAPRHVAVALAERDGAHRRHVATLERRIRAAEVRADNAEAKAGMTHLRPLQGIGVSSRIVESTSEHPRTASTSAQDALLDVERGVAT